MSWGDKKRTCPLDFSLLSTFASLSGRIISLYDPVQLIVGQTAVEFACPLKSRAVFSGSTAENS
jgi:hypothetical protein